MLILVGFVFRIGLHVDGHINISLHYDPSKNRTTGMILLQSKYAEPDRLIRGIRQHKHLLDHPALVPTLTFQLICTDTSEEIMKQHEALNNLQEEYGLHRKVLDRMGNPLEGIFNLDITEIAFASTDLAISERRLRGVLLQLDDLQDYMKSIDEGPWGSQSWIKESSEELTELTKNLRQYCNNLILKAEFDQKRAEQYLNVVSSYYGHPLPPTMFGSPFMQ